jgi:pyridoxal phosphate enzyme (YggS family)
MATASSRIAATMAGPDARESLPTSTEALRERYERLQEEVGSSVTIVVATKYVAIDDLASLSRASINVVGENRAQDLEAKHARYGSAFRWHFIGHLQSRKAKTVNAICELCHSLDSESAAAKLTIPALVEVNLSGEETKSGVTPEELPAFLALYPAARGLMTMPPFSTDPEASRPYFKRLRALAEEHGLPDLSMGTSQDYRVAVEEGATYVRIGSSLFGNRRRPQ